MHSRILVIRSWILPLGGDCAGRSVVMEGISPGRVGVAAFSPCARYLAVGVAEKTLIFQTEVCGHHDMIFVTTVGRVLIA